MPEVERRFSTMYPRRCTPPVSEGGVQVRVTDLEVTSFTLTLGLPGKPTDIMHIVYIRDFIKCCSLRIDNIEMFFLSPTIKEILLNCTLCFTLKVVYCLSIDNFSLIHIAM